jgi:hypothetical protein
LVPMGLRGLLGLGSNTWPGPYRGESLPRYLRNTPSIKPPERHPQRATREMEEGGLEECWDMAAALTHMHAQARLCLSTPPPHTHK